LIELYSRKKILAQYGGKVKLEIVPQE